MAKKGSTPRPASQGPQYLVVIGQGISVESTANVQEASLIVPTHGSLSLGRRNELREFERMLR